MAEAKKRFPEDMDYAVSLDTTRAVTEGIREIVKTLVIAILLVIVVVYIFLQGWRATLIPLLAVPVSLIGTFVFFPLFGFSINTLSLFGLVLAIGLVVDDAIVVVEAVERHIEEGLAPKAAALKAMEEISGPVIGIALVLSAVFVPTAFIPGITGRLYQQFAVTIAISVILSAFNALTLSPALAALLLKPKEESHGLLRQVLRLVQPRFRTRHRRLCPLVRRADPQERGRAGDAGGLRRRRRHSSAAKCRRASCPMRIRATCSSISSFPTPLPSSAPTRCARKIENILAKTPGVKYTTSVVGFSLLSFVRTSYNGFFFVTLKEWNDRKTREEQFQEIKQRLNRELSKLPEGIAFNFSPPAIPGVGTSGGFTFVLEDRAGKDVPFLAANLNTFMAAARKRPEIAGLSTTFLPSVPQQFVDVDRRQGAQAGRADQRRLPDHPGLHGRAVRELLQPLRPPVAGLHRGRRRLSDQGRERRPVLRAQQQGRNGAAFRADEIRIAPRPGVHHALQPVSIRADQRQRRAGLQLRAGDEGARRGLRSNHAARDGLRLHGHVVPGEEGAARRAAGRDLRVLAAVRVPDSGGAV